MDISFHYLGCISCQKSLDNMENKLNEIVQEKKGEIWALQHPLTYTCGVKFDQEHLLDKDLNVIHIKRGGSITLHNIGQLVMYFLLPLSGLKQGLAGFIRDLETSIIRTLLSFNIDAFVQPPHTGIFTSKGKIAFIGLGVKKRAVYHGIAINLFNDLKDYQVILSCGLKDPMIRIVDLMTIHGNKFNLRKIVKEADNFHDNHTNSDESPMNLLTKIEGTSKFGNGDSRKDALENELFLIIFAKKLFEEIKAKI